MAEDMIERAAKAACRDLGLNPDDMHNGKEARWQTEAPTIRAALLSALDPEDAPRMRYYAEQLRALGPVDMSDRDSQRCVRFVINLLRKDAAQGERDA